MSLYQLQYYNLSNNLIPKPSMNHLYSLTNPQIPIIFHKLNHFSFSDFMTQSDLAQKEQFNSYHYSCSLISFDHSDSSSFEPRLQPCIIVQENTRAVHNPSNIQKVTRVQKKGRVRRRQPQKQSRNVGSNLLRIFLKHVLELKFYQHTIHKIIQRHSLGFTSDQFYQWIQSFGINHKNYIRTSQVKKLFEPSPAMTNMQKVLISLLKLYIDEVGLSHCLTSRRIESHSTLKHLQGLRQLIQVIHTK